jgi:precorrin-3B C17-methyltransferase
MIQYYQENGKKKEKFSKFVKRMSMEALKEVVSGRLE